MLEVVPVMVEDHSRYSELTLVLLRSLKPFPTRSCIWRRRSIKALWLCACLGLSCFSSSAPLPLPHRTKRKVVQLAWEKLLIRPFPLEVMNDEWACITQLFAIHHCATLFIKRKPTLLALMHMPAKLPSNRLPILKVWRTSSLADFQPFDSKVFPQVQNPTHLRLCIN